MSAEGLSSGHHQRQRWPLSPLVRARAWLGLTPSWSVQVRVAQLLLLSLRVGLLLPLSLQVRARVGLLLLFLQVQGSGESVLLPLFLAVRNPVRSLERRR